MKPVIDKVYHLEETAQAFSYLQGGSAKGKVVIKIK
ncbi:MULTISPECIES: zinc-binding dehydrogenase [Paenibacillus]|nr:MULTISPECIES: zinc-binding dehydrogenase [Paenibacillus]MEC0258624.1 zinc-binding dehydrogenase [Paenibacillus lautus]